MLQFKYKDNVPLSKNTSALAGFGVLGQIEAEIL
jgi:hypothetical protein